MVSVGQAFGCRSAVWFGPGAPGEVTIRGWLWFRSRQRLVCSRVWGWEETLVQLGAGTEGLLGHPSPLPCRLSTLALQHGGIRVTRLLCWLRALKVCVTREKELEADVFWVAWL